MQATRGTIARRGLHGAQRPTRHARRRLLATATSTGLAAPLIALDGLPMALRDPGGPAWDALGPGSAALAPGVLAAASMDVTAAPAPGAAGRPPATLIADPGTETLRRATPWVVAAGVPVFGVASEQDVRQAAAALGLGPSETVGPGTVDRLQLAVLQRAEDVTRALGLVEGTRSVRPADVRAAAVALDVPLPRGVTPAVVDAVVAAGATLVEDHLAGAVTPYAPALGLEVDESDRPGVTAAVAAELGLDLPDVPGGQDAALLHRAWLQTLTPHFERLGVPTGATVDPQDVVALGRALGADVDGGVGPADLTELLRAHEERIANARPVPYGRVGGVTLHLPSDHVALAGFHESSGATALAADDLGAELVTTLPSRGRGTPARSAIDVATQPGTPVASPVSGTVVEAVPYLLYGEHPDTRIRIRPDDDPTLLVTVLHVTGPQVAVGDHVEVGAPLAAHATQFPFQSQIDELVGTLPHVHIEVKAG